MKKTLLLILVIISVFVSLPAFSAEVNLSIDNYILVEKKRVGRSDYLYTYKADIINRDTTYEAVNVIATLHSTSTNTTIIDSKLNADTVAVNGSTTSTDTFSIQQNRRHPFDIASISWRFEGIAVPPDPSEAGKATLEGIDSDSDGIRDDIQRYIAITYPNSKKIRSALNQDAKSLQMAILQASSKEAAYINQRLMSKAFECLSYIMLKNSTNEEMSISEGATISKLLNAEFINTEQRLDAYLLYDKQLGGGAFPIPMYESKNACSFDPDTMPN